MSDHYQTLGVTRDATADEVARAFRRLMRTVHPDVAGESPEVAARAAAVNTAFEVLRDAASRRQYDLSLNPTSHSTVAAPTAPPSSSPAPRTLLVHELTMPGLHRFGYALFALAVFSAVVLSFAANAQSPATASTVVLFGVGGGVALHIRPARPVAFIAWGIALLSGLMGMLTAAAGYSLLALAAWVVVGLLSLVVVSIGAAWNGARQWRKILVGYNAAPGSAIWWVAQVVSSTGSSSVLLVEPHGSNNQSLITVTGSARRYDWVLVDGGRVLVAARNQAPKDYSRYAGPVSST